jgi:hypothetical protein
MTTISAPSSFPPLTSHRQLTASELQEVCLTTPFYLHTFSASKKNHLFHYCISYLYPLVLNMGSYMYMRFYIPVD